MNYEDITVETVHDSIAVVTLNRPETLNAFNAAMDRELESAMTDFERDPTVRCVVVTGAGGRAFSAGGDIHEMTGLSPEEMDARSERRSRLTWHIANLTKPTIGAINGLAYGAAALLATALDIRIGCERTRFRFLAVKGMNSTWTLPLLIGIPAAKELLYTARVVEADDAFRLGLLNRVVLAGELRETAVSMARMIADNPPGSIRLIKRLLHEDIGRGWEEMLSSETNAKPPARDLKATEVFADFLDRKGKRKTK